MSIVIGRAIPSARTIRRGDVRSLLIIYYNNYRLWTLKRVLYFFFFITYFLIFSSVARVFLGMSSATNRGVSHFAIFSRYVILANLLKRVYPYLSFFSCFWVFLGISQCVFHAKPVMSADVNFGLVIELRIITIFELGKISWTQS